MMRYKLVLFALLLATFAGCGAPSPETTPVTGIVTFDGPPCANAIVSFIPIEETKGNGGVGYTNVEGKFTAHLHDGQTGKGPPGLLPGKYKVVINKAVNPDGTPYVPDPNVAPIDSSARELLPPIYSNFDQTTLQIEVGTERVDAKFELKSGK
jgi:hypothetical protein